jgi:nitroreductase
MENFLSLALQRQSDRAFNSERSVEREKVERVLEAARMAPSACNAQPWHFIVVDDPELKNKVADTTSTKVLGLNHFTKQAPIHIIVVEEKVNFTSGFGGWVKNKNFASVDIGIAAAHICLAAEDEGLGSCILGWFDEPKMRKLLSIPENKRILLDIIIGYSTQKDRLKKRKEADKVITYNTY